MFQQEPSVPGDRASINQSVGVRECKHVSSIIKREFGELSTAVNPFSRLVSNLSIVSKSFISTPWRKSLRPPPPNNAQPDHQTSEQLPHLKGRTRCLGSDSRPL